MIYPIKFGCSGKQKSTVTSSKKQNPTSKTQNIFCYRIPYSAQQEHPLATSPIPRHKQPPKMVAPSDPSYQEPSLEDQHFQALYLCSVYVHLHYNVHFYYVSCFKFSCYTKIYYKNKYLLKNRYHGFSYNTRKTSEQLSNF